MRATLSDAPDDHAILTAVGPGAFHRGLAYAQEGRVTRLTFDPAERLLTGSVRGSGSARYRTVVELEARRPGGAIGLAGSCSCPVGVSCKHVAAVVFAARRSPSLAPPARPVTTSWETSLAPLVRPPEEDATSGTPVLALQVEVAAATPATRRSSGPQGAPPRVLVRPVVRGAKGGWIRTGATWRDVIHGHGRMTFAGAAWDALRALHSQAAARNPYGFSDGPIDLATVGPGLWRLLDEVEASGVSLVPDKATAGPVRLVREGAGLVVDLRRGEEAGEATLEPLIDVGGRRLPGGAAQYLGSPVHGLFVVGTPAGAGTSDPGAGPAGLGVGPGPVPSLILARLRDRATAPVIRLVSGGRLTIPAADLERFVGEYYPALRQVLTVTSSDGSVSFPEVAPPSLGLTLTHSEGHRVALEWAFDYRLGDRVTRVPMTGAPSSGVVRDRDAEARLVDGLVLPDDRFPHLRLATPERPLAGTASLEGLDAVAFLEGVLPGLRESGVGIEEVGEALDYRRSEAAPLIRVSATDSDERDWFDLGVTVSVDGEEVPFVSLFTALARGQSHLLLDSGTYFSIERPVYQDLRRLIEEARSLEDREGPPRISRYQVSLWEDLRDLGEVTAQSERWTAAVRGLTAGLTAEHGGSPGGNPDVGAAHPPVPVGLVADLRPYQREGYEWLTFLWEHELGGVLADDMGLGKTLQVLATIARAKEQGRLEGPALVVAPTSVVPNWAREAARFTPGLRVVTVGETRSRRGTDLAEHVADADLVVASYALFRIEFAAYEALPWSALVLDEAQFVKNHQAKTYQCARRLAAPVKFAITGTPIENNLMDLWAMLSIAAPGLFPSAKRFTEVYRTPIEKEGHADRLQLLRRRIRPLMRRRTKEQVASELPPKVEHVLEVELAPRHRKVYDTHLQRERQKVLGMIGDLEKHRFAIFRSLTILRQLSLDAALVDERYDAVGSAKIEVLLENLRDVVDGGHRALVFSQFTGFLRRVRDRLDAEGVPYVYLDGRTRNRAARVEEFRDGRAPVFLISLKAGGFGLNLTEADYCFVLDPWWNPAVEAQAVDRTHRIGQDKTVMVYRLVAAGTIEEKVMALKARKQALFDTVMDEDGLMSGPLTADDIRGLFE